MTDKTTTETDTLEEALARLPSTVTTPGLSQDFYLLIGREGHNDARWWICYERTGVMHDRFYVEGEDLRHLAVEMHTELEDAGWL